MCTYNVRNLFLAAPDAGPADPAIQGEKPAKEFKALAGTIAKVAADVVCLQEVGSRYALERLNDALVTPYPHLDLVPGNSNRGIHLAVLSRVPMQLTSHRHHRLSTADGEPMFEYDSAEGALADRLQPLLFQRDVLLVELTIGADTTFAVFNTHLKSRTNMPWRAHGSDDVRAAEARELARILRRYLDAHPLRPVLLVGDFNDTKHSDALMAIADLGLTDPLGDELGKNNANPTTYWPKRRMRIDFILASAGAYRQVVAGSGCIHASQMAARASDHYPVSMLCRKCRTG